MFRRNKESFIGAPIGYTNLLVSDTECNLSTFSMDTLKTDIDTIISCKISPLNTLLKTHETTIDVNKALFATHETWIDGNTAAIAKHEEQIKELQNSIQKCIKGGQKIYINTLNGANGNYGYDRLVVGNKKMML